MSILLKVATKMLLDSGGTRNSRKLSATALKSATFNGVMPDITLSTLNAIPLIKAGDKIGAIIVAVALENGFEFADGDVLVIAQKIISKAENRLISLDSVTPGSEAINLAAKTEKDARLVQLILDESEEVIRYKTGVIIVRHRLGHVGANAGIDQSNIDHADGEAALLLPRDPDGTAEQLHNYCKQKTGKHIGIIVADSMNRPWRLGTVGQAIGCAGIQVLDDLRGQHDMFGREMKVAMVNRADSIAALATLLMGESVEGTPVVLARGLTMNLPGGAAKDIMRPLDDDLFN